MASIIDEGNGRRRIEFIHPDGSRKRIRLGVATKHDAETFKMRLAKIVAAMFRADVPDDETNRWIGELSDKMHGRLAKAGLVKQRKYSTLTLGAFLDQYIADRPDVKLGTKAVYGHTRRCLVEYFGADKPLREITEGDADQWRTVHLIGKEKLADNTVRRRCGIAKQFFRAAQRRKLIAENPFADLRCSVQGNKAREYFLSRADAAKVLDACPDAQWRLLFVLSRYGGLRCPSEHLGLKWGDVDWGRNRITIHSPKTEHHEGKESREIPIFPEILPHLREVFEQAEAGTEHIITRYRDAACNLRTQFQRIIRRAKLAPWPKLWHNLRSTRQTELAERYPIHVVCAWLGNTRAVAQEHYLQVTDAHFEQAAQKQAQQATALTRTTVQPAGPEKQNRPVLPGDSTPCETVQDSKMSVLGLEPRTL